MSDNPSGSNHALFINYRRRAAIGPAHVEPYNHWPSVGADGLPDLRKSISVNIPSQNDQLLPADR